MTCVPFKQGSGNGRGYLSTGKKIAPERSGGFPKLSELT